MRKSCAVMSVILLSVFSLLVDPSQAAPPGWPTEVSGDGIVLRFDPNAKQPQGTIQRGGQTYKFFGDIEEGVLEGWFVAGDAEFDFTLAPSPQGGGYILRTGNTTFTLKPTGAAPAPVAPAPVAPAPAAPAPGSSAPPATPAPAVTEPGARLLVPRSLSDATSKLDVATVLVPQGWEVRSQFEWRPNHANFVVNQSTIFDPRTGYALQYLPLDKLQCLPSAYQQAVQTGDLLTVSGMELCGRVPTPQQYTAELLIPRYRKIPGLKIVETEDLEKVTRSLYASYEPVIRASARTGHKHQFGATRTRVAYTLNNVEMEEDIYCLLEVTWNEEFNAMAQQNGVPQSQTWTIQPVLVYAFIAPKGQLKSATPVLQTIVSSGQITVRWSAFTSAIAKRIREINARDLQAMEATRAEVTAQQRASWREMVDRHGKINRNTGIQLTGHQVYADPSKPDGPKYILELKHHHWINEDGSIYSSPNSSGPPSGTGWKPMETVYPD